VVWCGIGGIGGGPWAKGNLRHGNYFYVVQGGGQGVGASGGVGRQVVVRAQFGK